MPLDQIFLKFNNLGLFKEVDIGQRVEVVAAGQA